MALIEAGDVSGFGAVAGGVSQIVGSLTGLITHFFPDKTKAMEFTQALQTTLLSQLGEENIGQIETNKVEAANPNIFVSGWRPAIGWVCASALLWNYLLGPILLSICAMCGKDTSHFPELSNGELMSLTTSLLGLGAMRTWEKYNGTEPPSIGTVTTKTVKPVLKATRP